MATEEQLVRLALTMDDRFDSETALAFADRLPRLVSALSREWELQLGHGVSSGATSVVVDVVDASGRPSVLKLSPDGDFLGRQAKMLEHFASTGRVPRVLRSEPQAGAILLERIIPGTECEESPPTTEEWASLLRDLHATDPSGIEGTLVDRCADMFERVGVRQRTPAVRRYVSDSIWSEIVVLSRELLATTALPNVIHGDLHLGNVLKSDEGGLVAIDPKLCIGDPCFDMVDFVIAEGSPATMEGRVVELAELTNVEVGRLIGWTRVNAVVTAISRIHWNGFEPRSAELLEFANY